MLALILVVLLVVAVLAPSSGYAGHYPAGWNTGYGWLPAILLVLVLIWLVLNGGFNL